MFNGNGTIENCHNVGNVIGGNSYTGGIAGNTGLSSTVNKCTNKGDVSGYSAGGIVGLANSGVEKCANIGNVTGISSAGGIVGKWQFSGTTRDCYNVGEISGSQAGGIFGALDGLETRQNIMNCYNANDVLA